MKIFSLIKILKQTLKYSVYTKNTFLFLVIHFKIQSLKHYFILRMWHLCIYYIPSNKISELSWTKDNEPGHESLQIHFHPSLITSNRNNWGHRRLPLTKLKPIDYSRDISHYRIFQTFYTLEFHFTDRQRKL